MTKSQFRVLVDEIRQLPYGRNSDRSNFLLVPTEEKGSCSTKHAYLKWLAEKEKLEDVNLILCIFKMDGRNTKAIKGLLGQYKLDYIPEAHCFLQIDNVSYDITFPNSDFRNIANDIIYKETIQPHQIGDYKINFHQNFLKHWLLENGSKWDFQELWKIREECISAIQS